jgi:hypothetical protein
VNHLAGNTEHLFRSTTDNKIVKSRESAKRLIKFSNRLKVSQMEELSVDEIHYRILSDTETIIEFSNDPVIAVFPRNCVSFGGNRIRVAHWSMPAFATSMLVSYSARTIFRRNDISTLLLQYLVFELGTELQSIAPSTFDTSQLKSVCLPNSSLLIRVYAFFRCAFLACVHFDCHSSLWRLSSWGFSLFSYLAVVTIPASVTQLNDAVFECCMHLRSVTYEFPSECWY